MILNQMLEKNIVVKDKNQTVISVAELELLIRDTVNDAMASNICQFKDNNKDLVKVLSVIEAIGDGDIPHGAARIQENHRVMTNLRRRSDAIAIKISNLILLIVVGGLVSAVWIGIKQCIRMDP